MDKIFIRERRRNLEGECKPRFRVVAATGNVKFFSKHVRKAEVEAIAEALGAEVVLLPDAGDGSGGGSGDGSGQGRRGGRGGCRGGRK